MPEMPGLSKKVITYRGYKELAYLHPNYFLNRNDELEKNDLQPDNYVFIREVSKVSLNYKDKPTLDQRIINTILDKNLKIILSLENKLEIDAYKNDCIIINEPVKNIHSLIKNARFTISSGDTVARESCILGTPNIYIGGRDMRINKEFIDIGIMIKANNIEEIKKSIDQLSDIVYKNNFRKIISEKVSIKWEDPTQIILQKIYEFSKART